MVLYASCTMTSQFWAFHKVIASLTLNFSSGTTTLQHHNHTTCASQGQCMVDLWWPWGKICFLPCLGCLENYKVASWHLCGCLAAPLRWPYGELVVAAATVRVPYDRSMVTSQSHCSHLMFFDLMNHKIAMRLPLYIYIYDYYYHNSSDL